MVDNPRVHISPPCIGGGSGSPWTEEQRGWPVQDGSASSSGPYTSAPVGKRITHKEDGTWSSTRERELGEELISEEGSLDEVLREQQSPGWYFGPGGPDGRIDEVD